MPTTADPAMSLGYFFGDKIFRRCHKCPVIDFVKSLIIRWLASVGYEFVRIKPKQDVAPINAFGLVVEDCIRRKQESSGDNRFNFIQIGANDGVQGDPLRPFLARDDTWFGVFVEPNPAMLEKLRRLYQGRSSLQYEQCMIGNHEETATLFVPVSDGFESLFSSSDKGTVVKAVSKFGKEISEIKVPCITLKTLFDRHNVTDLDLLQIDVEGHDGDLVEQLLQTRVRPTIIQFEHAMMWVRQYSTICEELSKEGYLLLPVEGDTIATKNMNLKKHYAVIPKTLEK
jgi:FkbM family methyltransferase